MNYFTYEIIKKYTVCKQICYIEKLFEFIFAKTFLSFFLHSVVLVVSLIELHLTTLRNKDMKFELKTY